MGPINSSVNYTCIILYDIVYYIMHIICVYALTLPLHVRVHGNPIQCIYNTTSCAITIILSCTLYRYNVNETVRPVERARELVFSECQKSRVVRVSKSHGRVTHVYYILSYY